MNKEFFHPSRNDMTAVVFKEKNFGLTHEVFCLPPDQWAKNMGATHTLFIGTKDFAGCGTRPAKLLKTVLYVMDSEIEGQWNKWEGKIQATWNNVAPFCKLSPKQMEKWPAL
jgi:hypothetical protein